ncbi:ABC transporter permease [Candidatus Woesearchaeota archaeon]|nr:ABC transporter permease [Candidatus Woesearchaeota archaeon]
MGLKYHWSLIKEFALVSLKLKYRGSVLGYLWAILYPLLFLLTLYVVFTQIININVPNYALFLLIGILLWNFLADATRSSIGFMNENKMLIRKAKFPLQTIVIGACLASFIIFILNLIVFIVLMLFFHASFHVMMFSIPIFLIELFFFVLGASFIVSALNIIYRDVVYIWSFILLVGFWITPIVYPFSSIPDQYLKYYFLNPMARIVTDFRNAIFDNFITNPKNILITAIICFAVFIIGYMIFKKMSVRFAEEI